MEVPNLSIYYKLLFQGREIMGRWQEKKYANCEPVEPDPQQYHPAETVTPAQLWEQIQAATFPGAYLLNTESDLLDILSPVGRRSEEQIS